MATRTSGSITIQPTLLDSKQLRHFYNWYVVITWLLFFVPIYPLYASTNPNAEILGRYSPGYAVCLATYSIFIFLYPFLLAMSDHRVGRFSNFLFRIYKQTHLHVLYAIICWGSAIGFLVVNRFAQWHWTFDLIFRGNILILGIWLALLPTFWYWDSFGWPTVRWLLPKPERAIPRKQYRWTIIITWLIVFAPGYSLLTYVSTTIEVWQRFSLRYAIGLTFYTIFVLLFPLLLGLPDKFVWRFNRLLSNLYKQTYVYALYIVVCLAFGPGLLVLLRLGRWGWGFDLLFQIDLVVLMIWLAVLPAWFHWSIVGWPVLRLSPTRWFGWLIQHWYLWFRPAVVAGVILATALMAYRGSDRIFMAMPGLVFGPLIVLIFFFNVQLGLLAIVASIIIPIDGPSGSNATLAAVAFMFGIWMLRAIVYRKRLIFVSSAPMTPLYSLVVISILAFGAGQVPWYLFGQPAKIGAQIAALFIFILSACAFIVVANVITDTKWIERATWLFLGISLLHIAGHLVPGASSITGRLFVPGATGSLLWMWGVALSFSQGLFNNKLQVGWRLLLTGLALAILYVGLFPLRGWNSGWTPSLVAVGAVLWAAKPQIGLLLTGAAGIGAAIKFQSLVSAVMIGDNEYSLGTRVDAWLIVWRISQANPILGLGPANYHSLTPLFPIRGYAVQFNSHSQFIDLIAQTGLLGLFAFLWFFAAISVLAWRLRFRVSEGFNRAFVYAGFGGAIGSLASAALGDWVIPFFYNVGMTGFRASVLSWVFLGGLVVLEQLDSQRQEAVSPIENT